MIRPYLLLVAALFIFAFVPNSFSQTAPSRRPMHLSDSSHLASAPDASHASNWSFLSLGACGVDEFLKQHPTADGRGTIIAILDDGVDPGIEGLLKTSEGKRKIIDVQDFSGTGDLTYQAASRNGDVLIIGSTTVLKGLSQKDIKPIDGKYFYASLDESRFKNGLGDLNFNGSKTDMFGVLIWQDAPEHFSAIVDADADGDVSDDNILYNYKERGDLFRFRSSTNKEHHDERFLSGAVNIFPKENRINLYFADGGHGTHVAGIAAGCNIDGQQGFNGVAPGAEVVCLKFADNTIGGLTVSGSMKHAYEYVVRLAEETGKPVIANMSFGIGSEIEGRSAMDEWLDSLLGAHPEVTVCISAGNEGPGLSNIGLPGSARMVITSGAGLPNETAHDLYGLAMSRTVVWDFSSRGGELAKPDFITPGTAISTVPDYVGGDRYNGTSMSSPYTTGCCAVLISGMMQADPKYVPNSNSIKRSLQFSAAHIDNMTQLDEGAGLANVPKAFDELLQWRRSNNAPGNYKISVDVPSAVGIGSAAYYRSGLYPKNGERTEFTIMPLEEKKDGTRSSRLGFNAFDLVSNAKWIEPVQSSIYRRGDGALEASVRYDDNLLKTPGLYTGKILGYKKGSQHLVPEFELWNTVIIPHELTVKNNFTAEIKNIPVHPGYLQREFFRIPAGTKAVEITMATSDGRSNVEGVVVNDNGETFEHIRLRASNSGERSQWITGDDISAGVWEIVIKRGIGSDDELPSTANLTVKAYPLDITPSYLRASPKSGLAGEFTMTNQTASEFTPGSMDATVDGYEREFDTTLTTSDTYIFPFNAGSGERDVSFDVSLDRADYNFFTDISLQILRPDSMAIHNGAFDFRSSSAHVTFSSHDTTAYTLKFRGGLADPDKPHAFTLHIRERREFDPLTAHHSAYVISSVRTLHPGQTETFSFRSPKALPLVPEGYRFYGTISFGIGDRKVELPLEYGL
ncbi:MAG TPA: S8 family serine peptidase [Candidatus Kapabacteria bacterium]|nr:S8 family serine peptidase [Candidatus Kapabacteria bacterium]